MFLMCRCQTDRTVKKSSPFFVCGPRCCCEGVLTAKCRDTGDCDQRLLNIHRLTQTLANAKLSSANVDWQIWASFSDFDNIASALLSSAPLLHGVSTPRWLTKRLLLLSSWPKRLVVHSEIIREDASALQNSFLNQEIIRLLSHKAHRTSCWT